MSGLGQVWKNLREAPRNVVASIFTRRLPESELESARLTSSNFFLHVHSAHTKESSLRPRYTLGLGVISAALFVILVASGVVLMVFYLPSTPEAYHRIRDLRFIVPGGQTIRNLHRWAAHAMVAAVLLHMVRVFFTASYRKPRELNWGVGIVLLILTFALSFTGYLLPWDQLAYWAITVGSNIAASPRELTDALGITAWFDPGGLIRTVLLGGTSVAQDALLRFYVLHCVILPGLLVGVLAIHLWRVRKDGGLSRPDEPAPPPGALSVPPLKTYTLMALAKQAPPAGGVTPEKTIPTWPRVIMLEVSIFMLVLAAMMTIALLFDAPLKELANPVVPENPAKAPWYFLGLQELVSYSAFVGGVVIPAVAILGLALIPYLDRETELTGVWFTSGRGRRVAAASAIAAAAIVIGMLGVTVNFGWLRAWFPEVHQLVIIFVNPGSIITLAFMASSLWVAKRTGSTRMAAISLFTMLIVGFVILTIMGTWFRGPNWDFFWSPAQWPGGHG